MSTMLAMKTAIKLGDVAHTAKEPALHRRWTDCIMAEFFAQGDEERERGMEVSPFMDRHTVSIGECQVRRRVGGGGRLATRALTTPCVCVCVCVCMGRRGSWT